MTSYTLPVITQAGPIVIPPHLQPTENHYSHQQQHDPSLPPGSYPSHQLQSQAAHHAMWGSAFPMQSVPVNMGGHHLVLPMHEVKAQRLTRDQLIFLENIFAQNQRPTTSMKRSYADLMAVPIEKINNWFQNRRAKVKQEMKKLQHAAAQQTEDGVQSNGVAIPEGMAQYTNSSEHLASKSPPTVLPSNDTIVSPEMSTTSVLSSSIPSHAMFSDATFPSAIVQERQRLGSLNGLPHLNNSTYTIPEEPLPSPAMMHFDPMSGPYIVGNDFVGFENLLNSSYISEQQPFYLAAQSCAPPEPSMHPRPDAHPSTLAELPRGIHESTIPHVKMEFSSPWTPDTDEGTITAKDSPLDPLDTNGYEAKPVCHDTPIETLTWPPGFDDMSSYFPAQQQQQQQYSDSENVVPTAVDSDARQHHPRTTSGGSMEPPELPPQAFSRRCSSTTTLVDSLLNVNIHQPPPTAVFPLGKADTKKSSQTLAARRQRRPATLNTSTFRSPSASMPSPGCLTAPPDLNLRKIKSTGIANGSRISKPLNSATAPRSPLHFELFSPSPPINDIQGSAVSTPSFFVTTPSTATWWSSSEELHSTESYEAMLERKGSS